MPNSKLGRRVWHKADEKGTSYLSCNAKQAIYVTQVTENTLPKCKASALHRPLCKEHT